MKSYKLNTIVFSIICLTLINVNAVIAQQKKELTVDWIYSKEAGEATALPAHVWLPDGTAILYDIRQPVEKRTFEGSVARTI